MFKEGSEPFASWVLEMKINCNPLPLLDASKIRPILNQVSLLGGMTESQLVKVYCQLRTLHFKKNDIIFRQNEQPTYIYIVLSGRVKIVSSYKDTTLELLELSTGRCFGETSLIGIQPHSSTAIAQEDCELIVISRDALQNLYDQDKELYSLLVLNIARETSRLLKDSRENLIEYAVTHPAKIEVEIDTKNINKTN